MKTDEYDTYRKLLAYTGAYPETGRKYSYQLVHDWIDTTRAGIRLLHPDMAETDRDIMLMNYVHYLRRRKFIRKRA